jgi:RNA recognition motif-containing protein
LRNGEGLVEFTERRAMETALEKLDNTELHGKKLRLTEEAKMMGGGRSCV